jgi:hypothetical protein
MDQIDGETPPEESDSQILVGAAVALIEVDEMLSFVLRPSTDQGRRGILLMVTSNSSPLWSLMKAAMSLGTVR